jgi:hypothetical protein
LFTLSSLEAQALLALIPNLGDEGSGLLLSGRVGQAFAPEAHPPWADLPAPFPSMPALPALSRVEGLVLSAAEGGILLACIALAAATLIFIFYIEPDPSDSAPHRSRLDQLLERRDTIYENLRDVKFEYRAGKFSDQDYEEMKRGLETEAAAVLAEIEMVTGAPRPAKRDSSAASASAGPPAGEKTRS